MKQRYIFIWLLFILGNLLWTSNIFAWLQITEESVAQSIHDTVTISQGLEPTPPILGEEAQRRIELTGTDRDGCFGIPLQPVDIMVIIDNSPSAFEDTLLIDPSLTIAQDLVTQTAPQQVYASNNIMQPIQIGMIISEQSAEGPFIERTLPLTTTIDTIMTSMESRQVGNDGDIIIKDGIPLVIDEFSERGRDETRHILVAILHDDAVFTEDGVAAFQQARENDIEVYIISIGSIEDDNAIQATGSRDRFLQQPTSEDLRRAFLQMTGMTNPLAAAHIRVTEMITPAENIIFRGANHDGNYDSVEGVINWQIGALTVGQTLDLNYSVHVLGDFQFDTQISWIDCNGFLQQDVAGDSLVMITPTPLPTNLITPTPSPTNTEESGTAEVTPPTIVTESPPITPTPPIDDEREWLPAWFNPLWCLIPLILVLLALLLWWLWSRRPKRPRRRSRNTPSEFPTPPIQPQTPPRAEPEREQPTGEQITFGRDVEEFSEEVRSLLSEATEWVGYIPLSVAHTQPNLRSGVYAELIGTSRRPGLFDELPVKGDVVMLRPRRAGRDKEVVPFNEIEHGLQQAQQRHKGIFIAGWSTTPVRGDVELRANRQDSNHYTLNYFGNPQRATGLHFHIKLLRRPIADVKIEGGRIDY